MTEFKRLTRRATIIATLLSAVLVAPTSAGAPRTRWVDDDGRAGAAGCDAGASASRKVQRAIDASADGDIVIVCPGRYRQNLYIGGQGADQLTLRAAIRGTAFLVAPDVGGTQALVSVDGAVGTEISGLVFQAPTSGACRRVSALLSIGGSPDTRVLRSSFEASGTNTIGPCGYSNGIEVLDEATAFVDEVTVRDFRANGVRVAEPDTAATVEDSDIAFLHPHEAPVALSVDAIGILVEDGATGILRRNTVRSAKTGGQTTPLLGSGILIDQVSGPEVARNVVHHTLWAISTNADGGAIHHNTVHHGRKLGDLVPIGIWVGGGQSAAYYANRVSGNSAGILMEGASHSVHDNDFRGNAPHDCRDITSGSGTAGTANFWTLNLGVGSSPTGICTPT